MGGRPGPYRIVRNPIYTGIILAMVGTAFATTWYALIPFAVVAGFFVYSAVREQRYLAGAFPDTYPAYQRTTKMLVPFIFWLRLCILGNLARWARLP